APHALSSAHPALPSPSLSAATASPPCAPAPPSSQRRATVAARSRLPTLFPSLPSLPSLGHPLLFRRRATHIRRSGGDAWGAAAGAGARGLPQPVLGLARGRPEQGPRGTRRPEAAPARATPTLPCGASHSHASNLETRRNLQRRNIVITRPMTSTCMYPLPSPTTPTCSWRPPRSSGNCSPSVQSRAWRLGKLPACGGSTELAEKLS
ncbi:unnamed protein product, partial [Urochloa humidicola]